MKTMKFRFSTILLSSIAAAILPVTGCGSGGGTVSGTSASSPAPLSRSVMTLNGVRLTLSEDKGTVAAGQSVTYMVTLTNITDKVLTYQTVPGRDCLSQIIAGFDSSIILYEATGARYTEVGNKPDCQVYASAQSMQLAPGASLTGTISTQQALKTPGTYTASINVNDIIDHELVRIDDLKIIVTQ